MAKDFSSPAPLTVRREVEAHLDAYSRSLDDGMARHFGVEPLAFSKSKGDWHKMISGDPSCISMAEADYVDHPVAGERCDGCSMFEPPDDCGLVLGVISPAGHCRFWERNETLRVNKSVGALLDVDKSSDHPDLHVKPENAEPIHGIPVADVVTRANVMHVGWEMVREGKTATTARLVPLDALIAIQEVVDRQRVLKHMAELRATGSTEPGQQPPLVLLWDGDLFILGGHHGLQAAYDLGVREVWVDVMEAPG